jgi:predicted nucleic acid-binding Zn ribbon protein
MQGSWYFKFNNDPKPCLICGKKFKPTSPNAKYCSDGCRVKAQERKKERFSEVSKSMKNRKKLKKLAERELRRAKWASIRMG